MKECGFDWRKWVSTQGHRRILIATQPLLDGLGVSQDYWDMAGLFSDLRNEHPAFCSDLPVNEALELGMEGLEAKFEYRRKQFESWNISPPDRNELDQDKAVLGQVIRDYYNGDKVALQVVSRMDDIRGGDGDIYRKISESRRNENVRNT